MGDELRLANIRGDKPRKQGSCVIALEGERAGDWIDFDDNQGGGPLSTLEHATGPDRAGADRVRGRPRGLGAGQWRQASGRRERQQGAAGREHRPRDRAHPGAGGAARRAPRARPTWPAAACSVPDTPDLLFHPDLTYWDTRTGYPALIAIVRDAAGEQIAIHRTYLAPDGSGKADVPKPRMMLGSVAGGAVRLGDDR